MNRAAKEMMVDDTRRVNKLFIREEVYVSEHVKYSNKAFWQLYYKIDDNTEVCLKREKLCSFHDKISDQSNDPNSMPFSNVYPNLHSNCSVLIGFKTDNLPIPTTGDILWSKLTESS